MSDDYLWDRSGDDAQVAELEALLGTYAHRAPLVDPPPRRPRRGRVWLGAGVLAAIAVAAIVVVVVRTPDRPVPAPVAGPMCSAPDKRAVVGFPFAIEDGSGVTCGGAVLEVGTLPVGAWLETPAGATAAVQVADIGEVTLGADSRLRLVATGPDQHRLELARGRLSARVSAPPRLFVVDTPGATAFDLGCAYDLSIEPDGRTRLVVTHGAVSLEGHGRTAFVPWGSEVSTIAGRGPGTPVATGAPVGFVAAVDRYDRSAPATAGAVLDEVLALAGENDAISVFNLLANAAAADRARILARLDELTPRPEWVLADDLLDGKPAAFAAWQEALSGAWFAPTDGALDPTDGALDGGTSPSRTPKTPPVRTDQPPDPKTPPDLQTPPDPTPPPDPVPDPTGGVWR